MLNFVELLLVKSIYNLRTEVSRYYLNYLWWVLEPVMTMVVFYIVFGIFLNRGTENFVGFLLIGLVFWQWFANCINQSAGSILGNNGLMLQVDIPKIFFPLDIILRGTFKHFFVMIILLLFLACYKTEVSITWLALPVLLVIQLLYIVGCGGICAAIVPFVPDLSFVIRTLIMIGMYASGVFYNIDSVILPSHRAIVYCNPMAGLLKSYREILMYGRWPEWEYLLSLTLGGMLLVGIATFLIHKLDHIYPRICQQ